MDGSSSIPPSSPAAIPPPLPPLPQLSTAHYYNWRVGEDRSEMEGRGGRTEAKGGEAAGGQRPRPSSLSSTFCLLSRLPPSLGMKRRPPALLQRWLLIRCIKAAAVFKSPYQVCSPSPPPTFPSSPLFLPFSTGAAAFCSSAGLCHRDGACRLAGLFSVF